MPRHHIEARQFLKRLPLFADLSAERLDALAAATSEIYAPRGKVIFKRGDPCNGFHTIIYGDVKLCFVSVQGDEKVVELLGPDQSFGEALMFMDSPHIVQAEALADCMLLYVQKQAIYVEIERNPAFSRRMLSGMSRRVHRLISDVESYSLCSGSQRVVGYLLKDEPLPGQEVRFSVSKKMIASRLNLSPEYFSRVLHDMAEHGMLAIDGRNITILDTERLRAYQG